MTFLPTSLPAQLCATGAVVWCLAWLAVSVLDRRAKRKADEEWVDALIARYHEDLRKRFRNGQFRPKESYGKFIVQKNDN